MNNVFRNIIAIIVGIIVGSGVNMALVMMGPAVVAPPAGVNMADAASLSSSAHLLEPRHFLFPFLAHALGAFTGAAVAFLLAASHRHAIALGLGAFFLLGGIAASMMIPAPAWFIIGDLLFGYLPPAWLGARVAGGFPAGKTPVSERAETSPS